MLPSEVVGSGTTSHSFRRVVRGSFHQGDARFSDTAGMQCMCNALLSICYSTFKNAGYWTHWDLDYILTHGNRLYVNLNNGSDFLDVDELPTNIMLEGERVEISRLSLHSGIINADNQESFLSDLYHSNQHNLGKGLVFVVGGYGFSIIWGNNQFFLFDSHSRDENALPSPSGASVLLHFDNLSDVEVYIRKVYAKATVRRFEYFQIQYVDISATDLSRSQISLLLNRKKTKDKIDVIRRNLSPDDKEKKNELRRISRGTRRIELNEKRRKEYSEKKDEINKRRRELYARRKRERELHAVNKEPAVKRKRQNRAQDNETDQEKINGYINSFKNEVRNGPFFICVICNRTFYRRGVVQYGENKYNNIDNKHFQFIVQSYDNREYICHTCNSKLLKGRIPCQAVSNSLRVEELPKEFRDLRKLEKVVIAKRLLFKKITIMPKGQSPKLRGSICNVPISAEDICNVLPRGMDNNGVVQVALKKRLRFKSNVYFEAVRPPIIHGVLSFLKNNNPFYKNIDIKLDNIPEQWINGIENLGNSDEIILVSGKETLHIKDFNSGLNDVGSHTNDDQAQKEEDENPLDELRLTSSETAYVPELSYEILDNTSIAIAPAEGNVPLPVICDANCEVLAHPHLFPTGKFGYTYNRDIPLSPTKYFNQRLLNYTQAFASESDYIFFAQAVTQHLNLNSSINIAMQKIMADGLTAGELSRNYQDRIKAFVANDEAFNFMNTIKGTPAYWKRFLFEVLAMVKQLGLPTYFMTLSCADLRWNELVEIISKLNKVDITEEEIKNMNYFQRTKILNSNPVLLARHFQYRVETFFKEIILSGLIGGVKHYAIRVEFQVRGSPHIHSLIWVKGTPILEQFNEAQFTTFVDKTIKCDIPDPVQKPELHDLVCTYQIHSHSRSCRKYKNIDCRYSFGKYFSNRTIIAEPLSDDFSVEEKKQILQMREDILTKVKDYIDTNLNPKVVNIHFPDRVDYQETKSIAEILAQLNIVEEEYYGCLSVSSDDTYQIHFKRSPKSCFVNNYFEAGLTAWEANLDIQPVLDYYKAVSYMCAYLSKSEDESSEAMKQAATEAYNSGKTVFEKMKSVARAYRTHREMSVQEAVAIVLPEIWLRKTSTAVKFANSNLPEKRYRICRTKEEMLEMPEDSRDIFKRNMLDRYMDRPNSTFAKGKYAAVDIMCYAEFLSHYTVDTKGRIPDELNDSQPEILDEYKANSILNTKLPKRVPLMSSKEYLKLRKEKCVLRYHVPTPEAQPEAYAHHLLFMFYPFRNEAELNANPSKTYSEKLVNPQVLHVVNENKKKCEPYGDIVDEAFVHFQANRRGLDPAGDQENDEISDELGERPVNEQEDGNDDENAFTGALAPHCDPLISDDMLNERIRTLNTNQRKVFEIINRWTKEHVKNLSSAKPTFIEPMRIFLTGSAGCGKSHLLTTIRYFLMKALSYRAGECNKDKVLVLAPTGVAAVNVDGATIHSVLGICPDRSFGKCVSNLTDMKRCKLRNKLSELRVIIIDEISMVSNKLLLHIHQRLVEIFGCTYDNAFAGLSIIACGDFYQLPPIQQRPVYAEFADAMLNISHPWRHFQIAELTEVMRQRGDQTFIDILNNVRIGTLTEQDEKILKSRLVYKEDCNYPSDAIHIWAENLPVNEYNRHMLSQLPSEEYEIVSVDKLPKGISDSILKRFYERSQMDTGGLAHKLFLKLQAKVMLTTNLDVADKLNNGQIGEIKRFKFDDSGNIITIYIKMEDGNAGIKAIYSDPYGRSHNLVPIKMIEKEIKLSKKKSSSASVKRLQFPLTLSWACTVHKVQGKTFKKVVVNFDLIKQRAFNSGQMYVALSRVTSLNGLFLTGRFERKLIKVDKNATAQYVHMKQNSSVKSVEDKCPLKDTSLTTTLLNVRSLQRHAKDIESDNMLKNCDIMCLTESQLTTDYAATSVTETLNSFNIVVNNLSNDRFLNIAYGHKGSTSIETLVEVPSASLFKIYKPQFSTRTVNMLLLYRKNNMQQNEFILMLRDFLQRWPVHVILGDFNINGFETNYVSEFLSEYKMIVTTATHISGSLLDHVYILKDFYKSVTLKTTIKNVYFSDHDAVKFSFSEKKNDFSS